ncbi:MULTISPECIES: hypothetical protein [unclassified Bartonella]|uniref:hypothetical protein n=1 Tax=unclassified Bartonella TaxID=2645622 RepID=UPI00235FCFBC|nr:MULTISPECIES: hypothetical protein [unclassified Bartonella]
MRSCGNRIIFIFFVFSVFGASLFVSRSVTAYRFLSDRSFSSPQVNITEEVLLEKFAVSFPDVIMQLSKLKPEQQKKLIEKMRHDIIALASASGQNSEQAQKLGRIVAVILSKAISHPSIVDTYF